MTKDVLCEVSNQATVCGVCGFTAVNIGNIAEELLQLFEPSLPLLPCDIVLLLSSLIGLFLLPFQDLLQRRRGLQPEQLLIVDTDTVGGHDGFVPELADLGGISRSFDKGKFLDLLVQFPELTLLGIDEVDLALVLLDLVPFDLVLCQALQGIGQQRPVGHGVIRAFGVLYSSVSISSGCFLFEDILKHIS